MNRTLKFAVIGAGAWLVASALYAYGRNSSGLTTANPSDTHNASFLSLVQGSATPLTLGFGAVAGIIASKVF